MSGYSKLVRAQELLQTSLKARIKRIEIDEDLIRLRLTLKSNVRIYVNYNNYNEYSYVIIYSPDPMDRVIVDNYDEKWNVSSSPNHIHNRHSEIGEETGFTGNPEKDIPLLINLI